jgi:CheY-like chemotaxis protein
MKRVLIVEDERDIRCFVRFLMEKRGHRVETAAHGAAGLEAVHWFHPDLVLLNIMMPVMDGFTMLQAMAKERLPSPPRVVVMSGHTEVEIFETALSLGAVNYIWYPADPKELTAVAEEALDRSLDNSRLVLRAKLRRLMFAVRLSGLLVRTAEVLDGVTRLPLWELPMSARQELKSRLAALSKTLLKPKGAAAERGVDPALVFSAVSRALPVMG